MLTDPKIVAAIIAGIFSLAVLTINIAHLARARKTEAKNKACEMFLEFTKSEVVRNKDDSKTLDFVETILLQSLFESEAEGRLLKSFLKFEDPQFAKEKFFRHKELFDKSQWENEPENIKIKKYGKLKWASTLFMIFSLSFVFGCFAIYLGAELQIVLANETYSVLAGLAKFLFIAIGILSLAICFPILDRFVDCLAVSESSLRNAFSVSPQKSELDKKNVPVLYNESGFGKVLRIFRASYESLKGKTP